MKDFLSRISSRKFIVWLTATVFLLFKVINGDQWLWASGIFIGGKAIEIIADKIGKKNEL